MILWIIAAAIGIAVALVAYAPALRQRGAYGWLAAARALATGLVAAVALGAAWRRRSHDAPLVALDTSASWTRAADSRSFRDARDSASRAAATTGATVATFGESLRVATSARLDPEPRDRATRVAAAADSAAATGRALLVVTDGELDDVESLTRAPAGSRAVVLRPERGPDAAITDVNAPADLAPGDTGSVAVTIAADAAGAPAGRVAVRLDGGAAVADRPLPALSAYGRVTIAVPIPVAPTMRPHPGIVEAFVSVPGDREPRNDTARRAIEITSAPRAVVVSTAPDFDVGVALSVLRGALAVPVRTYFRVAPGAWRVAGTLAPAREADVRAAAAGAALLVLHGDTSALGAPRTLGRGALALVPTADATDTTVDWYAAPSAAPGPLAALAGLPWDSLPPVNLSPAAADAAAAVASLGQRWSGVIARAGRRGPSRTIVAGGVDARERRVAVIAAGGFWRWSFRGGAGAVATPALWGALFDWLVDAPVATASTIVPTAAAVRSGAPVVWRGVPARDSAARARLVRRETHDSLSVVLRRDAATGEMQSDSPPPGVYDVDGGGVLVVNASAELLPRRAALRSGPIGLARAAAGAPATPIAPGWPLAAATLLLCAEWVARRRLGLR